MLSSLLKYLPISPAKIGSGGKTVVANSPSSHVPDGFYAPMSTSEQLATARREQWLQMLWDYSSLPKDLYRQYYLQPLERCVTLMQQFPATESGHHAYLGGMVDHLLETVAYAARLSKSYLLPVGAQPEEQASQSSAWNAVIVYAAMLQSLDGLCQIEVELESWLCWMPLNAMPNEPYRFRFKPITDTKQVQSRSAMLAWKIIPDDALLWLSTWPELLNTLSLYLSGFRNESGIVNSIAMDAIQNSTRQLKLPNESNMQLASELGGVVAPVTPLACNSKPDDAMPNITVEGFNENINLISALDNEPSISVSVAPADTTGDLLTIMGYGDTKEKQGVTLKTNKIDPGLGSIFINWLKKCLLEQLIVVNIMDSPVYITTGYVFVRSPTIFYRFLSENKLALAEQTKQPCDWRTVQKQFEKLKLHKRQTDGTNVYCCQADGRDPFNGYLIPVKKIYGVVAPPADSSLRIIK